MLLLNTESECARNILVLVKALSQLDNFYLIFKENGDYTFYLSVRETFCLQDFYNSRLAQLPNLILICDSAQLIRKVEKFGMVLTADCSASGIGLKTMQFLALCSELDIPVVEMQHSLFQYGIHYHAEAKSYAETISYGTLSESINVEPFAEHLLSFYPVTMEHRHGTVMGFPKYHLNELQDPCYDAGYILIISDFNFESCSSEDFCAFLGCIIKAAVAHPEIQFVWENTSSETVDCFNKKINLNAYENITLARSDQMLRLLSPDSLIKNASKVISTLSTALLDCEAYRKNSIVFKCESVLQLFAEINSCSTFSNSDQLNSFIESRELSLINTGKSIEFDNSKFRNFVAGTFHICSKPKHDILKHIARYSVLQSINDCSLN